MAEHEDEPPVTPLDDDRRKFLAACGKFAVVTPPALTVLLSTSLTSTAIARSGGGVGYGGGKDSFLDHLFDNGPDDPSSRGDQGNRGQGQQSSSGGAGGQSSGSSGGGQSSGGSGDGQSTVMAHSGSQGFGGSQSGLGGSASSQGNGGGDDKLRKGKKGPDR
jgi:hypothetical protein